ncbi:MAG TPA: glycosyltransferase, partial [Isosphaeraceae bacterium]|nr:glycosyltransferase [Isosphaeraceae bacterium]
MNLGLSQSRSAEARRHSQTTTSAPRSGWLHLCNGLDPRRDGGMVPSILGMTAAAAGRGGTITILTPTPSRIDSAAVAAGITLRGPEHGEDLLAPEALEEAIGRAEVVHMHGLWQGHTRVGAPLSRRLRVPYLIAAHGMLEPWALRHKGLKKRVYLALVEGRNLRRAACLHALSRPEVGHLRALAPWTPICLVPNGVCLEPFEQLPGRELLEAQHPELRGKFLLLFL